MRCKNCKTKFEPKSFLEKYCSNKECQVEKNTQMALKNLAKYKKEKKERKKEMSKGLYINEDKAQLQKLINKLARMIDSHFGLNDCIDCGKPLKNLANGGHFISVHSNSSLRYNLHNIHSQRADCNQNGLGGGKQLQYLRGIEKRYSIEYGEYLEYTQKTDYPTIHLTSVEIKEKKKIVNRIIREFENYTFDNPIQARQMLNLEIGIYTKELLIHKQIEKR